MPDLSESKIKVGVTTGLHQIGASPELASSVRKIGYALTRGTNVIEISGDVPHEIDYTSGKEMRYIAEKQGVELLLHGSLTVPMAMPERGEWRDAQNHINKSIRSAVHGGCKYVLFHSCLHFWLEMMTYTGRKLTMAFCDHEGNFISKILAESKRLREWFAEQKWDLYLNDILTNNEARDKTTKIEVDNETEREEALYKLRQQESSGQITSEQSTEQRKAISKEFSEKRTKEVIAAYKEAIKEKLEKMGKWDSEELRAVVGVIDGYHIMAHYLFFEKDPIWEEMTKMYKDVIDRYKVVKFKRKGEDEVKEYTYPDGEYWLDGAWEEAERKNDRDFKEFFYAVCAAKYLEGHVKKAFEWINEELIKKELKDEELKKIANELIITIEIPDARSPEYAGLYSIWRPKQIYAAIKVIRKTLKTDRIYLTIDFEHIATQGVDPLEEMKQLIEIAPDVGKYIISLHITKPSPLHHHLEIEIGDIDVYKLLWHLRTAGLGKYHTTYFIFERGGEQDPFKRSVTALKIMSEFLEKDIAPDKLIDKPEFFGVATGEIASPERQMSIIHEHAWDPLKGLIITPEETHTALGKAATEKGKRAEEWKKEELR